MKELYCSELKTLSAISPHFSADTADICLTSELRLLWAYRMNRPNWNKLRQNLVPDETATRVA